MMEKNTQNKLQKKFWSQDKSKRRAPNHPVIKYNFESKAKKLKSLIGDLKVKNILDCGCGNGYFQTQLSRIFKLECFGIDFSPEMVRINPNPNTLVASVTEIPFSDDYFDIVVCSSLLHHLSKNEHAKAISEMSRVAKYYIFIDEPNRNNPAIFLFSLIKPEERGALSFNKKYLENLCQQNKQLTKIVSYTDELILPNRTPIFLLPLIKIFDHTFLSHLGFAANILCKKNE